MVRALLDRLACSFLPAGLIMKVITDSSSDDPHWAPGAPDIPAGLDQSIPGAVIR